MPVDDVIALAEQFDAALLRRDTAALGRLIKAYKGIYGRLQDKIDALVLQIGTDEPTPGQVVRMERYKALIAQIRNELDDFTGYLKTELRDAAEGGIALGVDNARAEVGAIVGADSGIMAGFNVLPTKAVERLLGFLDVDGPLYARIKKLAPVTADRVAAAMVEGVGLGHNPRKIAAQITRELGMGLTDAMRTVRTAQLYSYREASRATYLANADVVSGWYWWATLASSRTCLSCISMHGTWHPSTEKLNDHHNGRCAPIPAVIGAKSPIDADGETWFNSLSEAKQRQIMGKTRYDLYKSGAFSFGDLSQERDNDVYGNMRSAATIAELLGAEPPVRMGK